ncbi:hypothetical protein DXC81_05505 [Collinsella tanakaei]|uniref:Uncharacterized protein n=1 Tax=Collinsella tanakaei TaxID=626935 RepID=A0A3E4QTT9_9ACTN|nr:hypothetical protein [Collinsella tanakaei]RGL10487.1 hypothetical protein DXC81_05505 [Collinsella tanakaei]
MTDDFFDDEQELMEADAAAASSDADMVEQEAAAVSNASDSDDAADQKPASGNAARRNDAPPFWMVLAIAAIALILGVVIGYMIGTSATLAELGSSSEQMAQQQDQSAGELDSTQLPEGHPQLSVDQDGNATVVDSGSSSANSSSANANADASQE